ncbi:M50 family metallopeptidase [Actinomadura sp. HBU206391]|uniref:M50 family metallopeptidase n=1 Tax=Actinomadura sp. HBU206391 TaxID=2731692 RepID=UPI002905E141|nr:M50 family metallopeptidase [Actinomadura sp. HBU206391]
MADSTPGAGGTPGREDEHASRRPGLLMGRLFGIPVYVSPTWFIVAVVITWIFEEPASRVVDRPASYLVAFTYAVLLYASVFVHELSHSVVARLFGLPVRAITLHILGGVSEIEREPRSPGREFLIAFAGPLLSLVLGAVGLLTLLATLPDVARLLVEAVTFANFAVAVFNLLPGLPLDGGRMIRAAIWKVTGQPRTGTIVAGWVGRAVAVLVLVAGAFAATYRADDLGFGWVSLIWSALIASFIWVGATQAIRTERVRDRIPLLQARRLARRATLVTAGVPLAEAVRRAHEEGSGAIVIVDHDGRPTGLVSEQAVLATPQNRRPWIEVGDLSRGLEPGLELPADLSGEDLVVAIRKAPATEYLLVEPTGRVYGVLAVSDLDRAFAGV